MSSNIVPWKNLRSEIVFNHKWYTLRRDYVELPNGELLDDYFVSVRPNGAVIFALTDDEHVVFVRQYKHAAGEILLELPGGVVDAHESSALLAAQRELLEETGYTADLEPISEIIDNPTKDTNRVTLYLGRHAHKIAEQHLDPTETIEVVLIPLAKVEEKVLRGEIKVSGSVVLCLLALRELNK